MSLREPFDGLKNGTVGCERLPAQVVSSAAKPTCNESGESDDEANNKISLAPFEHLNDRTRFGSSPAWLSNGSIRRRAFGLLASGGGERGRSSGG